MAADKIRPASTLVPIRQADAGIEALLLRRNAKVDFMGGAWVFPGGAIDPEDSRDGESLDSEAAARRAAVRETREEAGLDLDAERLLHIANWLGPKESPRRYATWFYLAGVDADEVEVDGGEIIEHRWMRPEQALAERDAGAIQFLPPTYVTLDWLRPFETVEQAESHFRSQKPVHFKPKIVMQDDGAMSLYEGDAAYDSGDLEAPGPRHRFRMGNDAWLYEKSD